MTLGGSYIVLLLACIVIGVICTYICSATVFMATANCEHGTSVAAAACTSTALILQISAATTAKAVTFQALAAAAIGATSNPCYTLRSNCSDLPSACCGCCRRGRHSEALAVALSPGHCCCRYDKC